MRYFHCCLQRLALLAGGVFVNAVRHDSAFVYFPCDG